MIKTALAFSFFLISYLVPLSAGTAIECSAQVSSQAETASCVDAQIRILNQALDQAIGFAQDAASELDRVTDRDDALSAFGAAQTAWIAHRDAQCSYSAALFSGGSGADIAEGACQVALTRLRINELMA